MRIESWDHYRINGQKFVMLGSAAFIISATAVWQLTYDLLSQNSLLFGLLVGAGTSYFVLSAPKRSFEITALQQARETPLLAAAASLDMKATGSRGKTILLLEASEVHLQHALSDAKRGVLLGHPSRQAIREVSSHLPSKSASLVLSSVVEGVKEILEEGEEAESISSFSSIADETMVPVFIAVSFFTPIMLILLAVLGHFGSIRDVVELLILQFVLIDLAFAFSSIDRRRLKF